MSNTSEQATARRVRNSVVAQNPALDSQNDIHGDEGARRMGFAAGLVPGSAIYHYLSVAMAELIGSSWQQRTHTAIRYLSPVYAGDRLTIDAQVNADGVVEGVITKSDETVVARGRAAVLPAEVQRPGSDAYPTAPMPAKPADFDEGNALDRPTLGSVDIQIGADDVDAYLTGIGAGSSGADASGDDIVPSAYLSRMYVPIVEGNLVQKGPGIHVSTELQHFRPVRVGERLSVRAKVDRLFGRRGSRYRVLDIAWVDDQNEVVMTSQHTGIYHLRERIGDTVASR